MPANHPKSNNKWLWSLLLIVFALVLFIYDDTDTESLPISETEPVKTVQGLSTNTQTAFSNLEYEVYFTNPNDPQDRNVEEALVQKIDDAETSIHLAIFEFDLESVAQALIRAQNRGVEVRIVYDNEYSDTDPQIGEVQAVGIPTVADNRSASMHNKFFIFDNACVWTGSFNITENASTKNNENAIYICVPELAINYETEFDEMYHGEFGPTSPSDTPYPVFIVDGVRIENYFGSEDHVLEKIINVVNTADTSIHFMIFSFTSDDLGEALISEAEKGITVEGIFETRGANTEASECRMLLNRGFDVRLDGNSSSTFHHKVIIIDGEIVIFGSFNFSKNADESNDENLLIIYDKSLALAFEEQYQLLKSQALIPSGNICE